MKWHMQLLSSLPFASAHSDKALAVRGPRNPQQAQQKWLGARQLLAAFSALCHLLDSPSHIP